MLSKFFSALDQFLSDVGGAAGLVLGVSLATLVGFLDCCLVSFFRFFHLRQGFFAQKMFNSCLHRNMQSIMIDYKL